VNDATERAATARAIIDRSLYMVLATADVDADDPTARRPWATPVYYAPVGYDEFFWVSSPEARHSRSIARWPAIGIVIFDSSAPIGTGQGVYLEADAAHVTGDDLDRGIAVFSARNLEHGGSAWTRDDLPDGGTLQLYRATVTSHSMLAKDGQPDHRVPVDLR